MTENENIIAIIRQMMQNGETSDQIGQYLAELGISQTQIQQLLLVSQNTIQDALQVEINQSVKSQMEKERKRLLADLKKEIAAQNQLTETEIEERLKGEQAAFERAFEQKMNQKELLLEQEVTQTKQISELVRQKLALQEQRLKGFELQSGHSTTWTEKKEGSSKPVQKILWILGIGTALVTVYYIFANQEATFAGSNFLVVLGLGASSAILMYLSSVV